MFSGFGAYLLAVIGGFGSLLVIFLVAHGF